jgi:hypothetical protein
MKIFIILISICFSIVGYGQQQKTKPISQWQPIYFIDSVKIDLPQLFFDPNKIADINVVSNYYDSAKQIHGKMFITSKDPKDFNFLSVADITNAYKKGTKTPTIFMLDNEFLKDIAAFKIDSSYILKVEVLRASEIEYLKNTLPNLTIVKIITRTKENLDRQNQIRIQGTETTLRK